MTHAAPPPACTLPPPPPCRFPYLHQLLADPGWTGTVFVPVDKAYVKGLKYQGVTTVAGALAQYAAWFEPATNPDFTNRQFYDVKCNWRVSGLLLYQPRCMR